MRALANECEPKGLNPCAAAWTLAAVGSREATVEASSRTGELCCMGCAPVVPME